MATKKPTADPLAGHAVTETSAELAPVDLGEPVPVPAAEDAAPAAPAVEAQPAAPPPAEPTVQAPPPEPVKVPAVRVLEHRFTTWRGQHVTLRPGKVLSAETHGPGIIEHLTACNIPFEPVV